MMLLGSRLRPMPYAPGLMALSLAFSTKTVSDLHVDSWNRLLATGVSPDVIDVWAHRFASERAAALQNPGRVVLFLCGHNAGRSQMSAAWFNHRIRSRGERNRTSTSTDFVGLSAGSKPSNKMNPIIIQAMSEVGVSLDGCFPKPWTPEVLSSSKLIITMGCGDTCPVPPNTGELSIPRSFPL